MRGVSAQERQKIERYLRSLNPDHEGPQFEVYAVEMIRRSHATGMAGAHIGEFPSRLVFELRVRDRSLGWEAEMVGRFEDVALSTFKPVTNADRALRPMIDLALSRLDAKPPTTTYRIGG